MAETFNEKPANVVFTGVLVVEVRRIELLSETISSGTSPGADSVCKIPFGQNPLSGMPAGSFMDTTDAQSFANEVSPFNLSRVRSAGIRLSKMAEGQRRR